MAEPIFSSSDAAEHDEHEYRALDPWPVIALLLGLASPLALVDPLLVIVPIAGFLASLLSLVRIGADKHRPGRRAALMGLGLSGLFMTVPPAHFLSANWLLARQAKPVADQFLAYLREGSPEKALLLMMSPDERPPADDGLWSYYRNDEESQKQLRTLLERPAARMLLTLGDRADIRYFKTNGVAAGRTIGLVDDWYTITFDQDGKKKTLVVGILLERSQPGNKKLNPWRVKDLATDVHGENSPL